MKLITLPSKSQQIADLIKSQINSGMIKPGSRLDNVRSMAEKFSVSTQVIICSYDILEEEKLIVRKKRKGAFVTEKTLNKSISVIIPKDLADTNRFRSECFNAIMVGITDVLSNSKYKTEIVRADTKNYDYTSLAGAIVFQAVFHKDKAILKEFDRHKIPWITAKRSEVKGINQVMVDNVAGVRGAIDYLIGMGHQNIGFLATSEPKSRINYGDYWEGYKQAFEARNLKVNNSMKVKCGESMEGGYRGAKKLLSAKGPVTAVFAGFDIKAIGVIAAAKEMGLKVPEDISVVGFYDSSDARKVLPPLTTVRYPEYEIGCELAGNLAELIEGRKKRPVKVVLNSKLIVRNSTGKAKEL